MTPTGPSPAARPARAARGARAPAFAGWAAALLLAGCASGPPVPDWQLAARASLERATDAWLSGQSRVAAVEFDRARGEVARTARIDLVARVELTRCAAQVASLQFGRCEGFEPLRADAAPAERAYADHLQGVALDAAAAALLPPAQQGVAAPSGGDERDLALLRAIDDPLSRLVGAGVWLQRGRASPAVIALALETASAQGWRRPLRAWLGVARQRAEAAGDRVEAERLGRRIGLIDGGPATP